MSINIPPTPSSTIEIQAGDLSQDISQQLEDGFGSDFNPITCTISDFAKHVARLNKPSDFTPGVYKLVFSERDKQFIQHSTLGLGSKQAGALMKEFLQSGITIECGGLGVEDNFFGFSLINSRIPSEFIKEIVIDMLNLKIRIAREPKEDPDSNES